MAFLTYDKNVYLTTKSLEREEEQLPSKFPEEVKEEELVIGQVNYVSVGGTDAAYIDDRGRVNMILCPDTKPMLPFVIGI